MDYRMEIASRVAELTGLAAEELAGYIEIPPNPEMGDYAFPPASGLRRRCARRRPRSRRILQRALCCPRA